MLKPQLWMSRTNTEDGLSVTQTDDWDRSKQLKLYKSNCASSSGIITSVAFNSCVATMAFKKCLVALFLALPLVLGTNLFSSKNVDVLNIIAASPSQVRSNPACDFLEPIKQDLLENLFENECSDTVSLLSHYYEHLSNRRTGSWCSASLFPWCHRVFSNFRVIAFTLVLPHR